MITLFTAVECGWNDSSTTFKMKFIVANATCSQVVYAYCFKNSFVISQLPIWEKKINCAVEGNTLLSANLNSFSSDHSGSQKYVDYIEHIHPNYIRELFRGP